MCRWNEKLDEQLWNGVFFANFLPKPAAFAIAAYVMLRPRPTSTFWFTETKEKESR